MQRQGSGIHGGRGRGQIIVLFALSLTASSWASVSSSTAATPSPSGGSQNAADFAALGGARVVAEGSTGTPPTAPTPTSDPRSTCDRRQRRRTLTSAHPAARATSTPTGGLLGYVGRGAIPAGTAGVKVASDRQWRRTSSFFGMRRVGAPRPQPPRAATRRPTSGTLFPAGISLAFFQTYPFCAATSAPTRRSVLSEAPDARQPQRARRLRLAQVRMLRIRARSGAANGRLR